MDYNFESKFIVGTDEVGVGDYFGPLVVCASYVSEKIYNENIDLFSEIRDSKMLSDSKIIYLFNKLTPIIKYNFLIIDNEIYNKLFSKYKNSHVLKALGHNYTIFNLIKDNDNLKNVPIIIDKFCSKENYFKYLQNKRNVIDSNIHFVEKADSKFLSVSCSSIIARAIFLQEIRKLENKFQIKLPLGANENVKKLARLYKINKKNEVNKFLKLHFKL